MVRNGIMKEGAANPPSSWSLVAAGPRNAASRRALRRTVTGDGPGPRVGAANSGFCGIGGCPSTTHQVAFWARATAGFTGPHTVTIESTGGAVHATSSVSGLGNGRRKFTTTLTTGPDGRDSRAGHQLS
ncbi:hypothetical protein [Dactylosporangium sp. NPDC000521]|uniref:hypothetical protein n=1 Tax=Dactylosporangium sp. NPDC000521 TaxID=3363975 RepID=UPI00368781CE